MLDFGVRASSTKHMPVRRRCQSNALKTLNAMPERFERLMSVEKDKQR
jgi:hypothetical protein